MRQWSCVGWRWSHPPTHSVLWVGQPQTLQNSHCYVYVHVINSLAVEAAVSAVKETWKSCWSVEWGERHDLLNVSHHLRNCISQHLSLNASSKMDYQSILWQSKYKNASNIANAAFLAHESFPERGDMKLWTWPRPFFICVPLYICQRGKHKEYSKYPRCCTSVPSVRLWQQGKEGKATECHCECCQQSDVQPEVFLGHSKIISAAL